MPEEKSKNKADAEAHEPGYEQERGRLHVLELAQHRHPFRHLASRLCEYLLKYGWLVERNDSGGHNGWPQLVKRESRPWHARAQAAARVRALLAVRSCPAPAAVAARPAAAAASPRVSARRATSAGLPAPSSRIHI